jgi:Rrf2 family protein
MKISTKGRYGLRMMLDIAQQDPSIYTPLKAISERQHVSMKYLEQITSLLNKQKFLISNRGPLGGYKLARKPEEYTIGEIIRATEGEIVPVDCIENKEFCSNPKPSCLAQNFWKSLQINIYKYLDSVTLKDVLDNNL